MNGFRHLSSADDVAGLVVNAAVQEIEEREGSVTARILSDGVQRRARAIGIEHHRDIATLIGVLHADSHFVFTTLDEGVGGLFDGQQIQIAMSTITVGEGIPETIDRMGEVIDHETYHRDNEHTAPMTTFDDTENIIIAGEQFTTTEIIEGLTVAQTGNTYVSAEYIEHERRLLAAAARAALTMNDLREAVNKTKDLRRIDDRYRVSGELVTSL